MMNLPLYWGAILFTFILLMWMLLGLLAWAQREFRATMQVIMEILCIGDAIVIIYVFTRFLHVIS
jgi:hypothetical protein